MTASGSEASKPVAQVCAIQLDARVYYYAAIVSEEDPDVVFRAEGRLPLYGSYGELIRDLTRDSIDIDEEERALVDLQAGLDAVDAATSPSKACTIMDAWNALEELAEAMDLPLDSRGEETAKIYDKVFWAMNLPSVTPEGESYSPIWRPAELERMRQILRTGVQLVAHEVSAAHVEGASPHDLWKV